MSAADDFSADWFADYLRKRAGQPVQVTEFAKFTRGTSRQTWFATWRDGDGKTHEVVLRADHPAGAGDPTSLDQEYAVYERLGRTDIPHARTLWFENDAAAAPRPFYLRERVAGAWQVPGYTRQDEVGAGARLAAAQEHMRALARVHDADWQAAGFGDLLGAPAGLDDAVGHYVRLQLGRLAQFGGEPQPLLCEVAEFLLGNAPEAARISLCKGTNGLGEEVFRRGRIVAMSDWEEVLVGDPASDLAMVQGFAEPIVRGGETVWDLERALEFYNAHARVPVSLGNLRFYQLARMFGRMVMFAYTTTVVQRSPRATVRQSWTATEVQHWVRRALAGALGIGEGVDPAIFEELNMTVDMEAG
ncbi:MAG: phosphotransferase [Sphingomonadales bacterium]|nr:phosphotransferase [Sphingomonadales bacterium]